ncbi:MAG: hypothetical protein HZB71_04090 [Betaproteobacteria bacterium]|nr:hypothetical protein [Betaproteobacteria bacterium]
MIQYEVEKYNFRIRTRSGVVVDRVSISGKNPDDANRRLMQVYPECVVLDTWSGESNPIRVQRDSSLEDVIDLITLSH